MELKDKVFKPVTRPAMTHGSEFWAVKKKYENKLNSAKMMVFRWAIWKARFNHIRNEDIRKEAHANPVEIFLENMILKFILLKGKTATSVRNRQDLKFLGEGAEVDRKRDGGTT